MVLGLAAFDDDRRRLTGNDNRIIEEIMRQLLQLDKKDIESLRGDMLHEVLETREGLFKQFAEIFEPGKFDANCGGGTI